MMDDDDDDKLLPRGQALPGRPTQLVADAGAAAVASAQAPFLYFDIASNSGINSSGICHITLEAIRHFAAADDGRPIKDFVVVGHVRCGIGALRTLKQAIEQIEKIVAPPGPDVARN